jgi:hypothetical protein
MIITVLTRVSFFWRGLHFLRLPQPGSFLISLYISAKVVFNEVKSYSHSAMGSFFSGSFAPFFELFPWLEAPSPLRNSFFLAYSFGFASLSAYILTISSWLMNSSAFSMNSHRVVGVFFASSRTKGPLCQSPFMAAVKTTL